MHQGRAVDGMELAEVASAAAMGMAWNQKEPVVKMRVAASRKRSRPVTAASA
jgi:hypothetical protein